MMEYKGYIATIEYDDSVDLLHGAVINAGSYPIVTFEAADVEGLKREFKISVEEYLSWCEEDGVEPIHPSSMNLNLNLGLDLHRRVAITAARNHQTIDDWITDILEREAEAS